MTGLLEGKLAQEHLDKPTVIIGAGLAGVTLAAELEALGHNVILLEAESNPLHPRCASNNNTSIFHALLFSADTPTMLRQFCAALGFFQLLPEWALHRDFLNFALPHLNNKGQPNSALTGIGEDGKYKVERKLSWATNELQKLYVQAIEKGMPPFFGPPEDLFRNLEEAEMKALMSERNDGQDWIGEDCHFDSVVRVSMPVANAAHLNAHANRQIRNLEASNRAEIRTNHLVREVIQKDEGFTVVTRDGKEIEASNVFNTAYTNGVSIDVRKRDGELQEKKPTAIKYKAFVIIKKPPGFEGKEFGGVIQARTDAPYILDIGEDLLAVNSATEYNLKTDFHVPGDGDALAQQEWETGQRNALKADKDYAARTLEAAADHFKLDWLKTAEAVDVLHGPQPYPDFGPNPTLEERAVRDKELHNVLRSPQGGVYASVRGAKLTAIPYACTQAALLMHEQFIAAGHLAQADMDEIARVDEDGLPFISRGLRDMMSITRETPEFLEILENRQTSSLPSQYTEGGKTNPTRFRVSTVWVDDDAPDSAASLRRQI